MDKKNCKCAEIFGLTGRIDYFILGHMFYVLTVFLLTADVSARVILAVCLRAK